MVARSDCDQDTCDDLRWLAKTELDQFLKTDYLSRFLWFGEVAPGRVANLQLILNATSKRYRAPAYVFFDQDESEPYLVALDRLAAVQGWRAELDSDQPFDRVVGIGTRGDRYPRVASVVEHGDFAPFLSGVLAPLRGLDHPRLLPEGWGRDCRVDNDLWYYLHREPAVPHVDPGVEHARTLLIAMPWLIYGGAEFAVRTLLEEGSLRRRFDRIFIVTFEEDENAAHALFEPLADGIYHLSRLGLEDEQKRACALELIQTAGVSDFFVSNSRHGYDLIPEIRKAKLPVRISAEIYSMGWDEATGLSDEAYFRVVAQHAVLINRLACNSDQDNSYMINQLYFPRSKIRTIKLGVDQEQFRPGDGDRSARPKQVFWCGCLSREKDPLLGLQVAERFQRERPDVKFLFIGNGPYRLEFVGACTRSRPPGT